MADFHHREITLRKLSPPKRLLLMAHFRATSVGVQSGPQALGNDLALLVQRPGPAPVSARDDFDTRALTIYLMSGLSISGVSNRGLVHE